MREKSAIFVQTQMDKQIRSKVKLQMNEQTTTTRHTRACVYGHNSFMQLHTVIPGIHNSHIRINADQCYALATVSSITINHSFIHIDLLIVIDNKRFQ